MAGWDAVEHTAEQQEEQKAAGVHSRHRSQQEVEQEEVEREALEREKAEQE